VTSDAATVLALLATMGGWYGARLLQARRDVTGAKQRLANARLVARRALAIAVLVGAAIYGAAYHWVHIHGG
jgi:hypothetical protein